MRICVAMLAVLGLFHASAQEPPASPTFRTGVSLVHVDAQAISADGRVLDDLQKADFRVFENSREQPIVQFAAEEQALDLILLFDISGSMQFVVREVSNAAHDAFQALKHGDRISVMVFNNSSSVISPFSDNLGVAEQAIREKVLTMPFGGGTYIQQAVGRCRQALPERTPLREAARRADCHRQFRDAHPPRR